MIKEKPVDAVREKVINEKSSTTLSRPVGQNKKTLNPSKNMRYLKAAG